MSNPFNGSKHGKRGRNGGRTSRKEDFEPKHKDTTSALIAETGKYYECYGEIETDATHIVSRESLTEQQHLRFKPETVEFESLRQRDKVSGQLVAVGSRVTWKSDQTLLRRGKPDNFGEGRNGSRFTRVTSQSKIPKVETEFKVLPMEPDAVMGTSADEPEDLLETI